MIPLAGSIGGSPRPKEMVLFCAAMLRGLSSIVLLIASCNAAAELSGIVTADEWSRPRRGEALVDMPALNDTISGYLREPGQVVVIRHPGEEEGQLWAEELRGWLVALGIESSHIRIDATPSSQSDIIELSLQPAP